MSDEKPAAFEASFSHFKLVPGRKVAQFIFEVPIEQADRALKMMGGVPQFGSEQWAGIARLTGPKAASETSVASKDAKARYEASAEREKAVARAAILCADPSFQKFLHVNNENQAAILLRSRLGINSRKHIATHGRAYEEFLELEGAYRDWQRFGPMPSYGTRNVEERE